MDLAGADVPGPPCRRRTRGTGAAHCRHRCNLRRRPQSGELEVRVGRRSELPIEAQTSTGRERARRRRRGRGTSKRTRHRRDPSQAGGRGDERNRDSGALTGGECGEKRKGCGNSRLVRFVRWDGRPLSHTKNGRISGRRRS
jgi:hypothetical protein